MDRSFNRQTYIIIGLIALLIALLLTTNDLRPVVELLISADPAYLGMATLLLILGYLILNLRWWYLLGARHKYTELLYVTGSGFMFGILIQLPVSIYRILVMERKSMAKASETSTTVVVEVILGLILRSLAAVLVISLLAARSREVEDFLTTTIIILAGLLILLFLIVGFRSRLEPMVARLLNMLPGVENDQASRTSASIFQAAGAIGSPKRFSIALFLSTCYWICGIGFYSLTVKAFSPGESYTLLAIAGTAMAVVPVSSPIVIGVYHGLLIAALVGLRLGNTTEATSFAIISHLIQMIVLVLLGMVGLRRLDLNARQIVHEVRSRVQREDV